jgi:hypothetical protein
MLYDVYINTPQRYIIKIYCRNFSLTAMFHTLSRICFVLAYRCELLEKNITVNAALDLYLCKTRSDDGAVAPKHVIKKHCILHCVF